ncbi:response regulator (plasmid) [Aminobacter sp. NyZ550]|uniref:response regulator transcription factor n=1 Tax=unclassified Aminobacter TaxID=2644704 RepID=UPI0021D56D6B|nr:response regulator [Aminobacter sp. NyZ550]WAX98681.1 response regulator [Aminobacter sp. NyZ550]
MFVVDDDTNLLLALKQLLSAAGWSVEVFSSTSDFEARIMPSEPGILLLDVEFPGDTGLELQGRLAARNDERPVIFMTGRDEVALAVQAMRSGAFDYLVKPFAEKALIEVLTRASGIEVSRQQERDEELRIERAYDSLSPRETEVMSHVVAGKLNKQIANDMALAEITVKVHRARMMKKMKASSVAALVRLHERLRRR